MLCLLRNDELLMNVNGKRQGGSLCLSLGAVSEKSRRHRKAQAPKAQAPKAQAIGRRLSAISYLKNAVRITSPSLPPVP